MADRIFRFKLSPDFIPPKDWAGVISVYQPQNGQAAAVELTAGVFETTDAGLANSLRRVRALVEDNGGGSTGKPVKPADGE